MGVDYLGGSFLVGLPSYVPVGGPGQTLVRDSRVIGGIGHPCQPQVGAVGQYACVDQVSCRAGLAASYV